MFQTDRDQKDFITHRNLVGVMDASKSTVSGISENLPFIKGNSYTFTVTAKDSSGLNVESGGEEVYVKVTNHCTRDSLMTCNDVGSSASVLSQEIVARMTDVGDGTYTYTATYNDIGNITAAIMLTHIEGVSGLIYDTFVYGVGNAHPVAFRYEY